MFGAAMLTSFFQNFEILKFTLLSPSVTLYNESDSLFAKFIQLMSELKE